MGFVAAGDCIWPVPPDWSNGVSESLAWGTDVMHASATAVSQHRTYQVGPTRSLAFDVAAFFGERRIADMLLAGHSGRWKLPIWTDLQRLTAPLDGASITIPCNTEGLDFVAGGQALLFDAPNDWEIVDIDTVSSDHLGLATGTMAARGPGARLYPLRRARVRDRAEERYLSDEISRRRVTFDIDEPCDWPGLAAPTLYLTHPVLDVRPDESEDPSSSYARLRQAASYDGVRPLEYDLPDQALRAQQTRWKLFGRAERSWFRSLLYTLDGRRVPMWLPSFAQDLQPAAAIAGGGTALSVEWAGYTLFGVGRHNRRDVRIELADGTVHYRRITGAVEAGATETLTLSASIDAGAIEPSQIRQVSFMALSTLASDQVEIEHVTDVDGVAKATLGWQAVVPDV